MITTIHEHSYESSVLPEMANILDLGCRGWLFHDHFTLLGHSVHAIDIDISANGADLGSPYRRIMYVAAISDFDGRVGKNVNDKDPQSTTINKKEGGDIVCYTLKTWMRNAEINKYDLIKMDIEGSEYQVIMSLEKAPATQLSIEFHLHTGIYGMYEMTLMEDKLKALGYIAVKHELTSEHGAGQNYWDSLFILK